MSWSTPRTWTTGELVTSALLNAQLRDQLEAIVGSSTLHGKISGQLLQRVDLASSELSITLDGIVSGFSELVVKWKLRSDRASNTFDNLFVEIDGDTTATNYHRQNLYGTDNLVSNTENPDNMIALVPASDSPTDAWATGRASLVGYDDTSAIKTVHSTFTGLYEAGLIRHGGIGVVHEDGSAGVIDTSLVLILSGVRELIAGSWAELWGY